VRINHNIAALNTYRQLTANNIVQQKSLGKLSSGLRINSAADDAAGLAISEKMRGQIRGLEQATRNAQDGISLIQTAEGALNETHSILQRMRELAVQSSNDTNTETDRKELQKEVDQLASELSRISNNTEFNTKNLLGGAFYGTFHIGANEDQSLGLSINAMDATTLGLTENVASVSAKVDGIGLIGADITSGSYFTEGTYTVELSSDGTSATLKDSDGNSVATATGLTSTAAETITFTSGSNEITVHKVATFADGASETVTISASGADLSDTTNTAGLTGVQMSSTDALAEGTYTVTFNDGATPGTIDSATITDSDGNVVGEVTELSGVDANTVVDITLDNGKVISFTLGTPAPTNGQSSEFTVTQSDYKSGSSSAAVDSDGDGVLDKDAVVVKGIDIRTQTNANAAITKINDAIETVSAERAKLGAYQNRLEHTINNLGTSAENLTASESRIRDVDMAKEMMEFTKMNILSQAAQAMLAQANQLPQGVLQLLR
jgi:flagellin